MNKVVELMYLEQVENDAWRALMTGSPEDARTVFGEEGKNYLAWCKAADACRSHREANKTAQPTG